MSRPLAQRKKRVTSPLSDRSKFTSSPLSLVLWKIVAAFVVLVCALAPYALYMKVGPAGPPDWVSLPLKNLPKDARPIDMPNICRVANAMAKKPLQFASYTRNGGHKPIGWPEHVPHVSSVICDRMTNGGLSSASSSTSFSLLEQQHILTSPVKSIFSFKSARSGSTFFTSVVTDVLKDTGRPTTKYWEPSFCSNLNRYPPGVYRDAEFQASSLRKLLTSKCSQKRGCRPARNCLEEKTDETGKDPVYIVAMNPRFLNQSIDWGDAVHGLGDTLRIFSLRRTNLILMAYSKFNHGGCMVDKTLGGASYYRRRRLEDENDAIQGKKRGKRRRKGKQSFTFAKMLQCIHHYTIGDQELSISSAFAAAVASKSSHALPYLILYEDVLSSGNIVQDGLLRHLGLANEGAGTSTTNESSTGNVFESNSTTKLHSDPLCHYNDVNCTDIEQGLQFNRKKYPCLWKQYQRAEEGFTWSIPVLPNGIVSLEGDCYPLEPLDERKILRTVEDLYQLPREES